VRRHTEDEEVLKHLYHRPFLLSISLQPETVTIINYNKGRPVTVWDYGDNDNNNNNNIIIIISIIIISAAVCAKVLI